MARESYKTRAKCSGCGDVIWSSKGSASVVCKCHGSAIKNHARRGKAKPFTMKDSAEWEVARAVDDQGNIDGSA